MYRAGLIPVPAVDDSHICNNSPQRTSVTKSERMHNSNTYAVKCRGAKRWMSREGREAQVG
jgi:hypothetical protein